MKIARKDLPDVGEFVIGTIKKIAEHGVYIYLDEYDMEAFAPTQEIVQSWFHSVREYVKEGQKAVFRVTSVNPKMRVVEVSLKRVRPQDKEKKLLQWRRELRAYKLLELAASKVGMPQGEALKLLWAFEDAFGDPLKAFEEAVKTGPEVLKALGLPPQLEKAIIEIAQQHIELPITKISGIIKAVSIDGDGVEKVRQALEALEGAVRARHRNVEVKIYVVGPPRYRIDLAGRLPKQVEAAFNDANNLLIDISKKYKIIANLQRIEK
ncbi:MAG: translation initiation factor IF-2 subunit alpha [Thermoproteus sp.]|nr:translation initiation factor IF-2 subunit alpha [Thermoproteus sp.]